MTVDRLVTVWCDGEGCHNATGDAGTATVVCALENVAETARDLVWLIESVFADAPDWEDRPELEALQGALFTLAQVRTEAGLAVARCEHRPKDILRNLAGSGWCGTCGTSVPER